MCVCVSVCTHVAGIWERWVKFGWVGEEVYVVQRATSKRVQSGFLSIVPCCEGISLVSPLPSVTKKQVATLTALHHIMYQN